MAGAGEGVALGGGYILYTAVHAVCSIDIKVISIIACARFCRSDWGRQCGFGGPRVALAVRCNDSEFGGINRRVRSHFIASETERVFVGASTHARRTHTRVARARNASVSHKRLSVAEFGQSASHESYFTCMGVIRSLFTGPPTPLMGGGDWCAGLGYTQTGVLG